MGQKTKILELLKSKPKTQGELSIDIYGDNKHMPYIYAALMNLVNSGIVIRNGSHPAVYSLSGVEIAIPNKQVKTPQKEYIDIEITNDFIEEAHKRVKSTNNYGKLVFYKK